MGENNLEYICEGCSKANMITFGCTMYAEPPSYYVRQGCCAHNRVVKEKKAFVRTGQQKQKMRKKGW